MPNQPIKVIIVDDHDIIREGLVLLLQDSSVVEVIAVAASGEQSLKLVEKYRPDIVLMDITMDGMNGLEATKKISESFPETNVIILTMHEDKAFFLEALSVGASGYFLKGANTEHLINAIESVHNGGTYLTPQLAGGLVQAYLNKVSLAEANDK